MKIFPLRFPDQPALHLGGWDYTDNLKGWDITPKNHDLVIAHLKEHFVDSPWATSSVLPFGKYDTEGNFVSEPDTSRFDKWIQMWQGARQYRVFAAVGDQVAGTKIGAPFFENRIKSWITFWAKHMQQLGLKPEQLAILLIDEPMSPQQDSIILAWAKPIISAGTGVRIWEDTCHENPSAANQEMIAACSVLCPMRAPFLKADQSLRDYYVGQRNKGKQLEFYSCLGPARLLDPYSYYRLQAWTCWQYGAKAEYYWAFSDSGGGSSWNEFNTRGEVFVPFFLDADSVTPAKEMEAIREGIEDYEYLLMLNDFIAEAEKKGIKGAALDLAKKILTDGVAMVCGSSGASEFMWLEEKDRSLADMVRIKILNVMADLSGEMGQ
jgi:hypothetical protein